jgi:signal transduction histidine kinase
MSMQQESGSSKVRRAGFFATSSVQNQADTVDQSGGAILALLQKAADFTQQDIDQALSTAHELSLQLRAAEERASKLEAKVRQLEADASKAEDWLVHIHKEIENKFFSQKDSRGQRS